jgi:hypothetical protein
MLNGAKIELMVDTRGGTGHTASHRALRHWLKDRAGYPLTQIRLYITVRNGCGLLLAV